MAINNEAAQQVYDTPLDQLPPVTRVVRESWPSHTPHPVASAEAIGALLLAVHTLEQRVIALEG